MNRNGQTKEEEHSHAFKKSNPLKKYLCYYNCGATKLNVHSALFYIAIW